MTLKDRLKIERAFCILACMPTTLDRINYYQLRWMRNDNRKGQRAFRIINMLRRGKMNKCNVRFPCGGFNCDFVKEVPPDVIIEEDQNNRCFYYKGGYCRCVKAITKALTDDGFEIKEVTGCPVKE